MILDTVLGPGRAARFTIFAGDVVEVKKPDPEIYELAVERLGLRKDETVVIEDSRNGLLAATRRRAAVRRHREQLHPRRGLRRGGPRRLEPRRPGPADARAREPERCRPGDHLGLPDLEAVIGTR